MKERNMLFGLMAVHHQKIPLESLTSVAEQTAGAQTDLGSLLVAAGTISEEDRKALDETVSQTIERHGGIAEALRTLNADPDSLRTLSQSIFGDSSHAETLVGRALAERSHMETLQSATPTVERSHMETIQTGETGNGDRSSMATIASVATGDRSAMETIDSEGATDPSATRPMFGKSPVDSVTLVALHGKAGNKPRSDMPVPAVCEHEGRYKLIKPLQQGGMGQIILVHDAHLGRDIALKTLLPDRLPSGGSKTRTRTGAPTMEVLTVPIIARFLQEAHVTGQLEHPCIIPIYELGYRPDGTLYYTMKFVRGKSIQDKLKEATGMQDRLMLLTHFLDICQAIGYAHSRGVVHRDIKPMNMMVGEFGETIVIDWGIAKVKGELDIHEKGLRETVKTMQVGDTQATARTMYGQTIGSPYYMPPEQAAGKTDEVDERADIYSLGALLYVILTGQPPYHGMAVREFLTKVQEFDPKPVLEVEKGAPKELAAVVAKAMKRKREDRYQSAMDIADEVQKYLSGGLVSAYQYRMSELIKRAYKRNKRVVNLSVFSIFAVLVVAAIGTYAWEMQRREARRELYFANINIAQDALEENTPEAARQRLASAPPEHNNWEWGYLARASSADLMTIPFDGQNVAYGEGFIVVADDKGATHVWNAETGEQTHTLLENAGAGYGFDFAKGAGRVAILGADAARVWEANSGTEIYKYDDVPPDIGQQLNRQISLSDDGRCVAMMNGDGQARVINLETKQQVYAATLDLGSSMLELNADGTKLITVNMAMDVELVDVTTGASLGALARTDGSLIKTVALSPDNRLIAIGTDDSIQLFDTATMALAFRYPAWDANDEPDPGAMALRFNVPRTIAFTRDGRHVAGGTMDGRLGLWDTATGSAVAIEPFAHGDQVRSVAFSPDDRYLITASLDHSAKLWEMPTAVNSKLRQAHEFIGHDGALWSMDIAPDGKRLVTTAFQDNTKTWDLTAEAEFHEPAAFAFSGENNWSAGALGNEVAVWDARTQYRLATLAGHAHPVKQVAFAAGSMHLLTMAIPPEKESPNEAKVWSLPHGELAGELNLPRATSQVALAQNGTILVGLEGKQLRVRNVADSSTVLYDKPALGFVMDPQGSNIAFTWENPEGSGTYRIQVLALEGNAREVEHFDVQSAAITTLAFGHQGQLAVATWDKAATEAQVNIQVLRGADGKQAVLPTTHVNRVSALAFSGDGSLIASGSVDSRINVFNVAGAALQVELAGHSDMITSVAFSPDNTRLASASVDKTFRLWNLAHGTSIITVHDEAQQAKGDVINPKYTSFNKEGDLLATVTSGRIVPPFVSRAFPWEAEEYPAVTVDAESVDEAEVPLETWKAMMEAHKRGLWQQ